MGVLDAFGVSALLHEYMIIGDFDIWTGEQFIFFMINGVILILWEAVFGREDKNEKGFIRKRILIILISIVILPFVRYSHIPSFFYKYILFELAKDYILYRKQLEIYLINNIYIYIVYKQ